MKTLKQKIEIMTAAADGARIQMKPHGLPDSYWTPAPFECTWNWSTLDYRIAVPDIALGHNPDKLTIDQVETHLGWRLLEPDEIKVRTRDYNEIQSWRRSNRQWNTLAFKGCNLDLTYRTKLTRDQLAALDNPPPKRRLPLGPEDFPPGTVLRWVLDKTTWFAVLATSNAGVFVYRTGKVEFDKIMHDGERSLDGGRTWLPCYKTT